MAVKKKLYANSSFSDIYDTQEALDKGILGSVAIPTTLTYQDEVAGGGFLGLGTKMETRTKSYDETATKDTLGSILGQTNAIEANRKKRAEQVKTAGQGFGLQSSILGGGPF